MNQRLRTVQFKARAAMWSLAILFAGSAIQADEAAVSILAARIGGHVHPSICRTKDGTLVVVYKGANVLMCARSVDDGATWSLPEPIATSARRPEVIREVKTFEVYPGTADTLPDDRILVTWNYIADDKAKDGYYQRALLYTISSDQGRTWSEQQLIGPIDGQHLGAVRHNVLPWSQGRWLLPLRVGPPRLFDSSAGTLKVFPLIGPDGKQHEFQQIVRTAKDSLLAMGPVLLHSADDGRSWSQIEGFPAVPDSRDNAEGRYLTTLADGRVLVTWGIGNDNKGLRYNLSLDDGRTWDAKGTRILLPETSIAARYYSARSIQLDKEHIGTVFMNRDGVHFLNVSLKRLEATQAVGQATERVPRDLDSQATEAAASKQPWQIIAPQFQPPSEWVGKLGDYRSPLLFDDGTPVKSAADWERRREELLRFWHKEMGPWPGIIEKPQLEILKEERREGLLWRRIRLEIAPNQTSEGWLLIPEGRGPFPAVLVVYYEPETSVGQGGEGKEHRDFGLQLARRGFVTLNIGTPGGNAWKPETGQALCQPLSYHAYVAANCWQALAGMTEVDRQWIGVTGHSYGGKWALFAAALWDKFAAVAVSDPGIVFDETRGNVNYWEPWYLGLDPVEPKRKPGIPTSTNPRTGAYKRLVEAGRDLHELHALIAPRPFLVSGGAEDSPRRWIALNQALAVNKLLGNSDRVGMTNRPQHAPNAESNAQLFAFFQHFLQGDGKPSRP